MLVPHSNISMYTFKIAGPQILLEQAALGQQAIRLVCVNPDLSETDLGAALDAIREVAAELPMEAENGGS